MASVASVEPPKIVEPEGDSDGLGTGVLIGIIVGGIAGAGILAVAVMIMCKRKSGSVSAPGA